MMDMISRDSDNENRRQSPEGDGNPGPWPKVILPPRIPRRQHLPVQPSIPADRSLREQLQRAAASHVKRLDVVPPLSLEELRENARAVRKAAGAAPAYDDYIAILISNEAWRETVSQIPHNRRLLLLPKCLRNAAECPAEIDEFGLVCKGCGKCSIHDLSQEAERLGYAVLVAEGTAIVTKMIQTRQIEAIVGVSCMNVLEKCFPHMEAMSIPGIALPLLQDGCIDTDVDLDWVWDTIQLDSRQQRYHLDLETIKSEVQSWFTPIALSEIMGAPTCETENIAREWLTKAGKRWRPYLTACVHLALQSEHHEHPPAATSDLKKLAIAVECFHKASLIHDDIEDNDDARYGERTLHVEYGVPLALNTGDFLLGEGYRLLTELEVDPRIRIEMLKVASAGHLTLSRGQGAELYWAKHPKPLSTIEVLEIFKDKTAPAFEVALRFGAFYSAATDDVHDVLSAYSESLGIAYQINDDLEDYSGESDSNDLRDLRPSVVLAIAHKRACDQNDAELTTSLWKRDCCYDEVKSKIDRLVTTLQVIETADELGEAYMSQAIRSLRPLSNATLKGLLRRVVGKIFGEHLVEGHCSEFEARNATSGEAGAEPTT